MKHYNSLACIDNVFIKQAYIMLCYIILYLLMLNKTSEPLLINGNDLLMHVHGESVIMTFWLI